MNDRLAPNDGRRDLDRAIGDLSERLPLPLIPLARITYDYRWSWTPDAAAVFRDIDPTAWRRSECNPRYVIETTTPHRLIELAADASFVQRIAAVQARLEAPPPVSHVDGVSTGRPIAYFCSEFAIHCSLPIYGGGLGVLAGDFLKAASDLGVPMVGVGMLYRQGYFHQRLDPDGWQHEYWINTNYDRLPLVRVTDGEGNPLIVDVPVRGRVVHIQVWRVQVGAVPLFLLDTDCDDNDLVDRWITARLYVGDRHTRLAQYAVLGIGGVRALAALGIRPALLHLNEGHAALGAFERWRVLLAAGRGEDEALAAVRASTIFTTHTPVAAGNEGYGEGEVEPVLGTFIDELGVPRERFYDVGRAHAGHRDEPVNITPLALRTSRAANAVSRRHGEVARTMWQSLWPDRRPEAVPISHVTNGVHTTTWMASAMQQLLDRHLGPDWRAHLGDKTLWARIRDIPDAELWQLRCALRGALVSYVRERSVLDRLARGESPEYVEHAARVFDPGTLTIGFARRVATYKRLSLLTLFPDRARQLLGGDVTFQLVLAGKAHPQDHDAKSTLHNIFQSKKLPLVGGRVAFLEDYDLHMAPRVVAGVDLWLNLPRPPLEASGTSGMKVVLNGGLNLSVLDGWWCEGYDGENGWAIDTPAADPATQDQHDAAALFDVLEREILPLFYARDAAGVPTGWVAKIKTSMATLVPRFTAERMLRDYVTTMYAQPR